MNRLIAPIIRVTIAAGWALLFADRAAADTPALSATQARLAFANCGYQVGNPGSAATSRYIVMRDSTAASAQDDPLADYRIVMAIVYTNAASADAAHLQAHRSAETLAGEHHAFSNDNGPQVLEGYGGSVWRGNVALRTW